MITKDTQVRLTINLEGRLATKAANSNSKKERKLCSILQRKGKSFVNTYNPPTSYECHQSVTLTSECVHYFASEESKPIGIPPSTWKKLKPIQRLEANLQINADYISGHPNTKYTYSLIQ